MKTKVTALQIFLLLLTALSLSACVTTTMTFPDGHTVKTTSTDPTLVKAIASGVAEGATNAGIRQLQSLNGLRK